LEKIMDKSLQELTEEIQKEFQKLIKLYNTEEKEKRIDELSQKSLKQDFWNDSKKAGLILKELENLKRQLSQVENLKKKCEDFFEMQEFAQDDEKITLELLKEGEEILKELRATNIKFQFKDTQDKKNAILVLHAGAGGTEACDWCEMLLRMYKRWCEKKGFKMSITDILPGEEAGIKSVTCLVKGEYAYGYLKGEAGVHRLVRVSPFDANKRRHTSFASVDVIPEIDEDIEIEIKPEEIKIDTYRASGHGGQHVNKTDSAVRITHIPTGIVVQCQNERSQHQNRETAMKLLKAKLYAIELDKMKEATKRRYDQMGQIGWGNQIRSYVFMPYQLVKDLRTGYETSNVTAVMDGDLDGFIEAYLTEKNDMETRKKEDRG